MLHNTSTLAGKIDGQGLGGAAAAIDLLLGLGQPGGVDIHQ
jgi:hypothetical protein